MFCHLLFLFLSSIGQAFTSLPGCISEHRRRHLCQHGGWCRVSFVRSVAISTKNPQLSCLGWLQVQRVNWGGGDVGPRPPFALLRARQNVLIRSNIEKHDSVKQIGCDLFSIRWNMVPRKAKECWRWPMPLWCYLRVFALFVLNCVERLRWVTPGRFWAALKVQLGAFGTSDEILTFVCQVCVIVFVLVLKNYFRPSH